MTGGTALSGRVRVTGAKNSALKLMAAALLAPGRTRLDEVPDILDVAIMSEVLRRLGCGVTYERTGARGGGGRVVARRAERSVWTLLQAEPDLTNPETARYLNRLSDLLFILARRSNPGGDVLWEPGAHSGAHAQRRDR